MSELRSMNTYRVAVVCDLVIEAETETEARELAVDIVFTENHPCLVEGEILNVGSELMRPDEEPVMDSLALADEYVRSWRQ
jgi:hypothetical protein